MAQQFPDQASINMRVIFSCNEEDYGFDDCGFFHEIDTPDTETEVYRYFRSLMIQLIITFIEYRKRCDKKPRHRGKIVLKQGEFTITWSDQ